MSTYLPHIKSIKFTKIGKNKILRKIKDVYEVKKKETLKIFYENKKGEKHLFDIQLYVKNKKLYIIITTDEDNKQCLNMYFYKNYGTEHIQFKKSYIENINKDKCGYSEKKKDKNMSGSFVLEFADELNKLLGVEVSELLDDSRINICEANLPLKIISLFKYGKTWYEKEGDFILQDDDMHKLIEDIGEYRLSTIYEQFEEIDEKHWDIMDYKNKFIDENKKKVYKLLEKINLSKNAKIKTLITKIFDRNTKLKECEQKFLWDLILEIGTRKYVKTTDDPKYKKLKRYMELNPLLYKMIKSKKDYSKKKN